MSVTRTGDGPPRLSVVIPAFNAAAFLSEAIESVLSQTFSNFEIVAGDDGSTDGTRQILDSVARLDSRVRLFHNASNAGPGETRRRLVEAARGELVAFQDADDISLPDRFARQVAAFEADSTLALCGSGYRYRLPDGRPGMEFIKPLRRDEILAAAAETIPYCCATIMARRHVVVACGSFRAYFNRLGSEDFDLALRITEQHEACNLPDVLYEYRMTPGSFSRTRSDPRQAVVTDIVRVLAAERRAKGHDCLDLQDAEGLKAIEAQLLAPFITDPSLDQRLRAGALLSIGDWRGAITGAWDAVRHEPRRLANYRALLYCLRRARISA